jgi:phospholipid-transporting ATPase
VLQSGFTSNKQDNKDYKVNIIFSNDNDKKHENNKIFKDNVISTTKYNLFTWMPKSLLLQFKRAANIYFLIISILTGFSFSPKNPITMSMTFGIVLVFTLFKEAYEVRNK